MAGKFERSDLIVDELLHAADDFASPDGVHDTIHIAQSSSPQGRIHCPTVRIGQPQWDSRKAADTLSLIALHYQ